jgi:Ser/Thr protein kinase RdoA (MazF antagonist)
MIRAMSDLDRSDDLPPLPVLDAFGLDPASVEPVASGLINRSWYATCATGAAGVLQRVNPIFPAAVNADIDAVTRHVEARGLATPRIVPARDGALWIEHERIVWRLLTRVEGYTRDAIETPQQALESGRVLGRFHVALSDFDAPFRNARLGVHDTHAHIAVLRSTLAAHDSHRYRREVGELADQALALAATLPPLPDEPDRVVHGDPKISNIVFEHGTDRAICLIDLDTLARMPVVLELGDAVRSWCHPAAEDSDATRFSLPLFEAAMTGYAAETPGLLRLPERDAIADAAFTIALELAIRFCADALNEHYFAWDSTRYRCASEHNQARTRSQLALARALRGERDAMRAIVARVFTAA